MYEKDPQGICDFIVDSTYFKYEPKNSGLLQLIREYNKNSVLHDKYPQFKETLYNCFKAYKSLYENKSTADIPNPEECLRNNGYFFRNMINILSKSENNDAKQFAENITIVAKELYKNWDEMDNLLKQKFDVFTFSDTSLSPINAEQAKKDFEKEKAKIPAKPGSDPDKQTLVDKIFHPENVDPNAVADDSALEKIKLIQRAIKSRHREMEHEQVFFEGKKPQSGQLELDNPLLSTHPKLVSNLKTILPNLASNRAVIKGELNHFTAFPNLQKVFKSNYFKGGKIIKEEGISITKGIKGEGAEHHDDNIVCFAPGHVDTAALTGMEMDENRLKSNLYNVIVKINKLYHVTIAG